VQTIGENWKDIAEHMENRNERQCKDRWTNYLSPKLSFTPWTITEDRLLLHKVEQCAAKWAHITSFFPGRTDANLKNRWFMLMRREARARRTLPLSQSHSCPEKKDVWEISAVFACEEDMEMESLWD
jgi:hypothetical protein